jgi:hypothetical protein
LAPWPARSERSNAPRIDTAVRDDLDIGNDSLVDSQIEIDGIPAPADRGALTARIIERAEVPGLSRVSEEQLKDVA